MEELFAHVIIKSLPHLGGLYLCERESNLGAKLGLLVTQKVWNILWNIFEILL